MSTWMRSDLDADEPDTDPLAAVRGSMARVAIVGRPNVGKSSLLNSLVGEERVIVSDVPGTTRDAIDTQVDWNGQPVRIVDTAGIRRRGKVAAGPAAEKFSALRALRAIGRADVAILVLDAVDGLTSQDAHVAGYVVDEGVGLVVVINKWDLVEKDDRTFDEYSARLRAQAPFLGFAPILAVSAKTGQRVSKALDAAVEIARGRRRRISDRGAQPGAQRCHLPAAAAAGAQPPTQVLLRHAGIHRAAHVRALRERLGARPLQLPALPREPAAGRVRVRRHAPAHHRPRAFPRGAGAQAPPEGRRHAAPRCGSRARARPEGSPTERRRGHCRQSRAVVGAGAWGTTLALLLARSGPVTLVARTRGGCRVDRGEPRERAPSARGPVAGRGRRSRPTMADSRRPGSWW